MGSASSEIKCLVLKQLVLDEDSQEIVERFFSALEKMNELSELTLDRFAYTTRPRQQDQCEEFVGKLDQLRARGVVVHVKLSPRLWL